MRKSDTLVLSGINTLKDGEEIIFYHPKLKGIEMIVSRETKIMPVLGVPTRFYGTNYAVRDNADTIHNEHDVLLNPVEMSKYIETLSGATTKQEYHYIRKLQEKGLKVGSKIEFEDGKTAVIAPLTEDCPSVIRALFYIPLKKDGKPSKVKPRILYGGTKFTIIE